MIIINDIVNSKDKMLELAEMASEDCPENFELKEFSGRLNGYLNYYTAIHKGKIVAMAGMFQSKYWNPKLVRVLDRCYYFPEARSSGLNFINEKELKTTASTYFLPKQTKLALKKGLIPFWSIYGKKRRGALERQVKRFNSKNEFKYIVLPGQYWTCNRPMDNKGMCWQNIAVLEQYKDVFDLPKQE